MRNTYVVQAVFGTVLWIVCAIGLLLALIALIRSGKTWEDFGKNRLLSEAEMGGQPAAGSAASVRERDVEIRQMLEARNARRIRRGEAPIDVELELSRLTATTSIDDELRSEIRDLVVARNHRRARAGKAPLDVEAEVEREIAGLQGL